MADPATVFVTVWVMVRPVHQSAEIIPLIHTAKLNAVSHPNRYPRSDVDVVGDQQ